MENHNDVFINKEGTMRWNKTTKNVEITNKFYFDMLAYCYHLGQVRGEIDKIIVYKDNIPFPKK